MEIAVKLSRGPKTRAIPMLSGPTTWHTPTITSVNYCPPTADSRRLASCRIGRSTIASHDTGISWRIRATSFIEIPFEPGDSYHNTRGKLVETITS
jgi:hypothetical protein